MKTITLFVLIVCALSARASALDENTVRLYLERELGGIAGRIDVSFGEVDPRRALAPCARIEPFVPPGTRLWGRTAIGVRCGEGPVWTAFLPVHIRVFAPALVAARTLAPGKPIEADDYRIAEVELTREPPGVLTDGAEIRGRVPTRPVAAGQALRSDLLRARPTVNAGDIIQIVHEVPGLRITTEGKALGTAAAGETVRVQTTYGRVLTAVAGADRVVHLSPVP